MLNRNFTYAYNHEAGGFGLKAKWMANADPADGRLCMHDMLEHFKTQTSALEGECEAIGAFIFLRLENMALRPGERAGIGSDVHNCLEDAFEFGLPLPGYFVTRKLSPKSEAAIAAGIEEGFSEARTQYEHRPELLAHLETPLLREAFRSWIRRGYRRARQRYLTVDTYYLATTVFPSAAKALDKVTDYLTVGDEVGVSIDLRELTYYIRVNGISSTAIV